VHVFDKNDGETVAAEVNLIEIEKPEVAVDGIAPGSCHDGRHCRQGKINSWYICSIELRVIQFYL
jgi:hypothetical protein